MSTWKNRAPEHPALYIHSRLMPGEEMETTEDGMVIVCPGHPGTIASGTIAANPEDPAGEPLLECWHGCRRDQIIRGLKAQKLWFWGTDPAALEEAVKTELFSRSGERGTAPWIYKSLDENGDPFIAGRVVRVTQLTPEGHPVGTLDRPQRPTSDGRWLKAGTSYPWPIYNRLEVIEKAKRKHVVINVNDELECDLLDDWRLVGFCHRGGVSNPKGFAKARPERDCDGSKYVLIIPQQDRASFSSALAKARHLSEHEIPVKILWLPRLLKPDTMPAQNGPGLLEWAANQGGTRDELIALGRDAEFWKPEETDSQAEALEPPAEAPTDNVAALPMVAPLAEDNNPYSEMSLALVFSRIFGEVAKYIPETSTWVIWRGTRWSEDNTGEIKHLMAQAVEQRNNYFRKNSKRFDPAERASWYKRFGDDAGLRHAVELAKSKCKASLEQFDANPLLLNAANCVINLETGEALEHDKKYMCMKQIPWEYKGIDNFDCPRWIRFLSEVFVKPQPNVVEAETGQKVTWKTDHETIQAFARAVGYSLTGLVNQKLFFLLLGKQDAGKSKIGERLLRLGGKREYSKSAKKNVILLLQQENKYSDFYNIAFARIVVMDEIGGKDTIDDEKMKSATGGDQLTVSKTHQQPFDINPSAKIWIYGNERPKVHGNGNHATWIRITVFPFYRTFAKAEQQQDLDEELDREMSGILAWAVRGCMDFLARKGVHPSQMMVNAKAEYKREMDELANFVEGFCDLDPSESCYYYATELFNVHYNYQRNILKMKSPWTLTRFGKEMAAAGFQKGTKDGKTIYKGIRINPTKRWDMESIKTSEGEQ